ncbi:MAG: hypothetical protein IPL74_20150 [Bacteroidetes bacterium]|nr:hypothetical protein [Bacteroidota bacterium]
MKKTFSGQAVLKFLLIFSVVAICLFSMGTIEVKGEGSPQYKPDTTKTTYLMVLNNSNGYGTFAGYSATDTNRLFIRILDPANERIYFRSWTTIY